MSKPYQCDPSIMHSDSGGRATRTPWVPPQVRDLRISQVAWTVLLFSCATAAAFFSQSFGKAITTPLVYILGVTVIGATQGLLLGVVSAVLAALIYNFAITDPIFVFRFSDIDDLVPIIAFNLSALISGTMAGRLKDSVARTQKSKEELQDLLQASQLLQSAIAPADLARVVPQFGPLQTGYDVAVLINMDGALHLMEVAGQNAPAANIVNELASQLMTDRLEPSVDGWAVYSLKGVAGLSGVILVRAKDASDRQPAASAVEAFVNVVAITLERCVLFERLASSKAIERSEAFKTALLSSVSHDMRTPLAAISASATGLLEYEDNLSLEARAQLLNTIKEQCARLNRYTTDLLNLGRVQAGFTADQMSVVDVVEVLGRAVTGIRPVLGGRDLRKSFPPGPIFAQADAILLEQVFHNVLENAVYYSPDISAIDVSLSIGDRTVTIVVLDEGIGIPEAEQERVFQSFYRIDHPGYRQRGTGLGLAIARAFTEAVGGSIAARSPINAGAGTEITIKLPLSDK